MYLQVIMILGALFGFLYALRVKESYARIINWTMVVAVGVTFVQIPQVVIDGYYLFALTQVGVIVYALSRSDFSTTKKGVIGLTGLLSVLPMAFFLQISPYFAEVALITGVLQLGVFIYALKTDIQSYKEEMGFMTVLAADALVRVIGSTVYFVSAV